MAGSNNYPAGARSVALSHATVSFSDAWSSFHNQAGIADLKTYTAAFYFESRYGIDELSLSAGTVVVPSRNGGFAVTMFQFGSGTFRENKYGFGYAHILSEKWRAGLQLDYFTRHMPENEAAKGFATFEGGLIFRVTQKLHLGGHVFNPIRGGYEYPAGVQKMPLVVRVGGHYNFDDTVLLAFETQKDNLNSACLKAGIEFLPAECLMLRLGVSGSPLNYTAGFGYYSSRLSADVGFGYHGNLGITPSIALQFSL